MTGTAFHDDNNGRHLTSEQIAEYRPNARAIARRDLLDPTQQAFAQTGELLHIAKIEAKSNDQVTILLNRDNGVDGPDESRMMGLSGSWVTIAAALEVLVDLNWLDELLEEEVPPIQQLVGRSADWHGKPSLIVPFKESLAIKVTLECARCGKNPTTVYARSGCHAGAFCYVYSESGEFQADLRNQEYVCDVCDALVAARRGVS